MTTLSPSISCIKVKTRLTRLTASDISPSLTSYTIRYVSLPVLQTTISGPTDKQACGTVSYNVNFANSYGDEK